MIPTFKIGGVVFSATFTRFAAESMADLSGEFLCIVKLVDQWQIQTAHSRRTVVRAG